MHLKAIFIFMLHFAYSRRTRQCEHGYYGDDCSRKCGQCRGGVANCDRWAGGECRDGCLPGYYGPDCVNECPRGYHGIHCVSRCHRCLRATCDGVTGACHGGCVAGRAGATCSEYCPFRTYGEGCAGACRHCFCGCHPVTGQCYPHCTDDGKIDRLHDPSEKPKKTNKKKSRQKRDRPHRNIDWSKNRKDQPMCSEIEKSFKEKAKLLHTKKELPYYVIYIVTGVVGTVAAIVLGYYTYHEIMLENYRTNFIRKNFPVNGESVKKKN